MSHLVLKINDTDQISENWAFVFAGILTLQWQTSQPAVLGKPNTEKCHFKLSSCHFTFAGVLVPYFPQISFFFFVCFGFVFVFRAAPYGGSQAKGQTGAVAASLHHSHSNAGSLTHWARPEIKPTSSWILVGFVSAVPLRELPRFPSFFT